ncbi:hypothetical protein [Sinomicrobium sp. M5D2P9]
MKTIVLTIISMTILLGCKDIYKTNSDTGSVSIEKPSRVQIQKNSITDLKKIIDQIEILSLKKANNYPSSLKDTTICKEWKLDKRVVKEILGHSRPITPHEWNYLFEQLPCTYSGKLKYQEKTYSFTINSGAWFTTDLLSSDSLFGYGCFDKECQKYFLSNAWNPEEEN